jgi:hypothetical protein
MTTHSDIFSVATTLTREIVDEVIQLSDRHHITSDTLFKAMVPQHRREPFYSSSDWSRAQKAAPNLPKISLEEFLSTLSVEQMIELTALAWLGRGDGPPGTVCRAFDSLRIHSRYMYNPDDSTAYLMSKPLGRYLQVAIELDPNDVIVDVGVV